jgi:hypothetical protein
MCLPGRLQGSANHISTSIKRQSMPGPHAACACLLLLLHGMQQHCTSALLTSCCVPCAVQDPCTWKETQQGQDHIYQCQGDLVRVCCCSSMPHDKATAVPPQLLQQPCSTSPGITASNGAVASSHDPAVCPCKSVLHTIVDTDAAFCAGPFFLAATKSCSQVYPTP